MLTLLRGIFALFFFSFIFSTTLFALNGENIFKSKCASCHKLYIPVEKIKENLIQKNQILHLKAPSLNMMAWAMLRGPKRLGAGDSEFLEDEVIDFLTEYLYNPNKENSLCEPQMMQYYDKKPSMKGKVSQEEIKALAKFFINYKAPKNTPHFKEKKEYDEDALLEEAKKKDKLILLMASSKTCTYCKKEKEQVLSQKDVQDFLAKNFIFKEVDIDEFNLPFELDNKAITPAFFVLDRNGSKMSEAFGFIPKKQFLQGLKNFVRKKQ